MPNHYVSASIDSSSISELYIGDKEVNILFIDSTPIFIRAFTYSTGTMPTGVASFKCYRDSSLCPSASTGELSNGATIYYGDKLHFVVTASTGYNVSCNYTSSSSVTVTGNINGVSYSSVTASRKTWSLKITKGNYMSSVSYSINSGSNVSVSSSTTLTLDYSDSVVVSGVNEGAEGYSYGTVTGTGTFTYSSSAQSTTVTCTRTRLTWSYTINLGTGQTSFRYKINDGSWVSKTSNYTISSLDYSDTLTIEGTGASTGYSANTSSYSRTYSNNGGSVTITATRLTWSLTIKKRDYCASVSYTKNGGSSVSVTSDVTLTLDYSDYVDVSATAQSEDAYNYGTPVGTGRYTYSSSAQTARCSCTRELKSFTITFSAVNYGSWDSTTETAYYGDTLSRSGNTVTCNDSNGNQRWTNTFTNGSATGYTYSVSYSSITSPVTGAQTITATASRSANTYNIKYTMNDGTHSGTYATTYTFSTSAQSKSIGTASRTGYSGTVSTSKGTISGSTLSIPASTTGDITVTWSWSLNSYTITFEGTNCSWGSSSKIAHYGDTLSVSGTKVTCTGTSNWENSCTKGSETGYTFGTPSISNGTGTVTGTRTITGTSTKTINKYTVKFSNPSNGYWSSTTSISNVPYGTTVSVSGNTVTINGESRTLYANSSTITEPNTYSVSSVGITNGSTITSTKTLTGSIHSARKQYGCVVTVAYLYANPMYWYNIRNDNKSNFNNRTIYWTASAGYSSNSGAVSANSSQTHNIGYSNKSFTVTFTYGSTSYTVSVPAKGSVNVSLYTN